jgi:uncharacterized protein (DUF488 family)
MQDHPFVVNDVKPAKRCQQQCIKNCYRDGNSFQIQQTTLQIVYIKAKIYQEHLMLHVQGHLVSLKNPSVINIIEIFQKYYRKLYKLP